MYQKIYYMKRKEKLNKGCSQGQQIEDFNVGHMYDMAMTIKSGSSPMQKDHNMSD